jgi:adenine C2-methylase RlmN of 23S rRNA A2503 and tRNA A37
MGFSRQLTVDEIFEQVSRFSAELVQLDRKNETDDGQAATKKQSGRSKRLSNVVFMGMGE